MSAGPLTIRPLAAEEWRIWRALRLAALADSPDAFGPTLVESVALPEEYWQESARRVAGPGRRLFVLYWGHEPAGTVSVSVGEEDTGHLGAVWVDPRLRGQGAGARLFDTACAWLAEQGCRTLLLWVTETNSGPRALYERRGFALTGVAQPLREGSPLRSLEMRRDLPR